MRKLLLVSLQKYGAGPLDSWELSEALCRSRYPHAIIVSRGNELRGSWKNNEYRRVHPVPTFESKFVNFFLATILLVRPLMLFLSVSRQKPDVIHVTHFHPWVAVVFCAARLCGAKVIYTLHDNPFAPKERGLAARANRFEAFFARRADAVVTHSNFVKNAVSPFLTGKPIYAIPLGAYAYLCRHLFQIEPLAIERKGMRFLFLGRIESFKGLDVLVEAYRMLLERIPNATLTIAGRGFIAVDLRDTMQRLGIRLIQRWLETEETCALMAEADAVVLPYRNATQSGVVSLAMAYGVPVIASRVGGLPEQVIEGETGFLVSPGDSRDLAAKMETLAKDHALRERFRENQRRLAETTFSWDESCRLVIGIVEGLR